MIYSNERKLYLSGWLKNNDNTSYETPLKLQKFLLFYEAFTKVSGETPDFSHLRGYKKGPVFSNVWGDYTLMWRLRMRMIKMLKLLMLKGLKNALL